MEDAKRFYRPVNLLAAPTLQQPDLLPWGVSSRPRSLADLSSLAPTTAPCSPDGSTRGGARTASPALPPGASNPPWGMGQDAGPSPQPGRQARPNADENGTAIGSPPPRQSYQSGITRDLRGAAPTSPAPSNRDIGGICRTPERARAGQLFPTDSDSRLEARAELGTDGSRAEASLSPWAHAGSGAGRTEGRELTSPAVGVAASRLSAPRTSGKGSADLMSSIAMSPQRMPAMQFQEYHPCNSSSESKRSVSEPRQRIKWPPPSSREYDAAQRHLGRRPVGQPAQNGQRPMYQLQIASPTHQVTPQPDSWYSAEPSSKHARSTSLDGIRHGSMQGLARFGAASTSSYGDIVSPGSFFLSSPGCAATFQVEVCNWMPAIFLSISQHSWAESQVMILSKEHSACVQG